MGAWPRTAMAQPAPAPAMIVKIKRKRDEPALPEFVLASKKPSLARLTLDDDAGSAPGGGTAATAAAAMGSFASPPPQGLRAARAGGTRVVLRRNSLAAVHKDTAKSLQYGVSTAARDFKKDTCRQAPSLPFYTHCRYTEEEM